MRVSSIGWRTGWFRYAPKWLAVQESWQQFDAPISMMSSVQPPFDLGPGQDANLHLPVAPFSAHPDIREEFFNRRLPFQRKATPTKICVLVHLVAAKRSVTRVEKRLAKFLATSKIDNGAARVNERMAKGPKKAKSPQ